MTLLVLCPSRTRPDNAAELIESFQRTCRAATRLVIAVDNDDPEIIGYHRLETLTESLIDVEFVYGERLRLGGTLNLLAPRYAEKYYAIGFMGDDHRPRTAGWDVFFLRALQKMGYGYVYGNDLLQGKNLPTQVAMTSSMINALGYMVPPGCTHLFFDNMWKDLGAELRKITYLPNVIVEHMHPLAGKADVDDLYRDVNSKEMYAHDAEKYQQWKVNHFKECVRKVEQWHDRMETIDD